ncbi:bacitracin transport system ATP-binding protein [Lachnotalea glycerini]|uniref:ABC transporter ATP-binding protein n=1 Tax=Lachnotalea glycerini TaxID=1763509 RepID=A0A255IHY1_9FIRM|nr:ABC transporter ATP-binding protein [Lachnotalea glycerini]PXV91575.1 bacitracin transport system ATP-binding protein [Lachnotalea glycerini]RDY28607.1 ABC transporter ATP-binding protein [Lachnotalea glycerini]
MQDTDYVIEMRKLTKKYKERFAVKELDIKVPRGKIYGLLGRNGAGKTTIMRMMLNLAVPTEGEILLFGESIHKNKYKMYHKVGSLIEAPGFYGNLTGEQNLKILAKLRGTHKKESMKDALEIVGLEKESNKIFADYSLGMKQRLGIAAAIMHEPKLLILDEPINGLDPVGIVLIRNYLERLCHETGTTIFISSHIISEIEQIADVIGILHDGEMVEEATMETLHKRNRQYVEFVVSDSYKACLILEEIFHIKDYCVNGQNSIQLFQSFEIRADINQVFVENEIKVFSIHLSEQKLEDYFKDLIGGEKIG